MGERILTPFGVEAIEEELQRAVAKIQTGKTRKHVIPIVSGIPKVCMTITLTRFDCGDPDCRRCHPGDSMSEDHFICDGCGNKWPMDEQAAVTLAWNSTVRTCRNCVSRENDPEEKGRKR